MPTKDIFKNFGLVSKRFHGLIGGIKHLQAKIIDLNMIYKFIEIVKEYNRIIELDLENISQSDGYLKAEIITNIITLCENLKSLRVSGKCDINMDTISILNQKGPQFEHLQLKGIGAIPEVLIEISKLKFLKSLCLVDSKIQPFFRGEIMYQVFQNLSKNTNQLESIDFEFQTLESKINEVFNELIYEKRETLKKVRFANSERANCNGFWPCESYNNLNLCKNLQELSGNHHLHEFQHTQSKLKRLLMAGRLNSKEFSKFSKINLTNLEHFEVTINGQIFGQFSQLQFPALQYLMIQFEDWDKSISFWLNKLMQNSPNLKAVTFKGKLIKISRDFLFETFERKGIIISVKDCLQEDFEMASYFYKTNRDIKLFEKYQKMKTLYWRQFSDFQH